jgi:hypothetical protein
MKLSRRRPASPDLPELETVTDYRIIALGGGLLLAFLAIPLVASLFTGPRPEPSATVAAVKPPRQAPAEPATPVPPVTPIRPQLSFPSPEPYPVRKAPPAPPVVAAPAPAVAARPTEDVAPPAVADTPPRTQKVSLATPPGFKRRTDKHNLEEQELRVRLQTDVPEVKLDSVAGTSKKLLATSDRDHPVLDLFAKRPDLAGLPARQVGECQASAAGVINMKMLGQDLLAWRRTRPAPAGPGVSGPESAAEVLYVSKILGGRFLWVHEDCVSTLEQVLQAEEAPLRLLMVKQLAKISGPLATAALARRAVFDLSRRVREEAVEALRTRPANQWRPTILVALRYPWAPAADHAAEALVNLGDRASAGDLAKLCDLPDPCAPAFDAATKKWLVPELVRVNHLGNCLLCHAPSSADRKDPLRAPVPEPGQRLPLIYYEGVRGPAARFDVTYLRQDFAVPQRVENAKPWPEFQRFDYLVRKRELPAAEGAARAAAARGRDYPQREAVLFALRELDGMNAAEGNIN